MDLQPQLPSTSANRSSILAAIERRLVNPPQQPANPTAESSTQYTVFDKDHSKRQEFRRLIDPGITRHNSREVASNAIKTLLALAENIVQHPDEPKYQKFKPTNTNIKARIIDPKGTLEYAIIALGFTSEVVDFQPYYIWHKKRLGDLRIGLAVLKEFVERENLKEEQLERARLEGKAAAEAQIEKVKQAFLDDRKSRMLVDERERERRAARAAGTTSPAPEAESPPPPYIPGTGRVLSGSDPANPILLNDDEMA